jgi:spore coat polysaccharide biosynthesis protein SpsF (cytidylyltransferase family)
LKLGIIIQARLGSTRMPRKVLREFADSKSILKILTDNLKSALDYPIIVATTTNSADDAIVEFCRINNLEVYRGSESDVLSRFIEIAEKFEFTHCIRVCSDNPFIYPHDVKQLIAIAEENPDLDYVSFRIAEKPSILTHFGFWTELASVAALRIAADSGDVFYYEHVTNYIYSHPDNFKIQWIDADTSLFKPNEIRLTVDQEEDFRIAQDVYKNCKTDLSPENIVRFVNDNPVYKKQMTDQINRNTK